jgi:prepilin-type N-terminal cleavage/methylation domain-containing protein
MTRRAGFTLVEIMIAVAIIGLLAALGLPSILRARQESRASLQLNELRILDDAFQQYAMANVGFPDATWTPGVVPAGMASYFPGTIWTRTPPAGGAYAWKKTTTASGGTRYYISLVGNVDARVWSLVDQRIDDGDPSTGKVLTGPMDHAFFIDQ